MTTILPSSFFSHVLYRNLLRSRWWSLTGVQSSNDSVIEECAYDKNFTVLRIHSGCSLALDYRHFDHPVWNGGFGAMQGNSRRWQHHSKHRSCPEVRVNPIFKKLRSEEHHPASNFGTRRTASISCHSTAVIPNSAPYANHSVWQPAFRSKAISSWPASSITSSLSSSRTSLVFLFNIKAIIFRLVSALLIGNERISF